MQGFYRATSGFCKTLNVLGAVLLTLMMLLTVADVILRFAGKPITGTFELMSFAGAWVTGLALAQTSLDGAHVNVDILLNVISVKKRNLVLLLTKLIGLSIFGLLAFALFIKGQDLYRNNEVSLTLHVPFFPVAFGLSFCCLVQFMVVCSDILKAMAGGAHE
jgi:TRAP-type C4-dicarboxylate transport system permease small subunit